MRYVAGVLLVSGLFACSQPQDTVQKAVTAPSATQGEVLLADAPDAWVQTNRVETPEMILVEYTPDTDDGAWVEKVSFETMRADPVPDPLELLDALAKDEAAACEGARAFNTFSGMENGYPTSVRLLTCPHNALTEQGQITMIKVIQGNERLFTITRAKRVPPFQEGAGDPGNLLPVEEMAMWSRYMRAITACDNRSSDAHTCPEQEDQGVDQKEPADSPMTAEEGA